MKRNLTLITAVLATASTALADGRLETGDIVEPMHEFRVGLSAGGSDRGGAASLGIQLRPLEHTNFHFEGQVSDNSGSRVRTGIASDTLVLYAPKHDEMALALRPLTGEFIGDAAGGNSAEVGVVTVGEIGGLVRAGKSAEARFYVAPALLASSSKVNEGTVDEREKGSVGFGAKLAGEIAGAFPISEKSDILVGAGLGMLLANSNQTMVEISGEALYRRKMGGVKAFGGLKLKNTNVYAEPSGTDLNLDFKGATAGFMY